MGSVTLKLGDGTARHKRASLCSSALNFIMLFSVLATNLFALYAFSSTPKTHIGNKVSLMSEHVSLVLREISSSQKKLAQLETELLGYRNIDISKSSVPNELKLFLQFHPLPLGKDSRTGMAEMVSSVGHSCESSISFLSQFMDYKVGGVCPDDWNLAQKLILRGCEPLPRRRCLTKPVPKRGFFLFYFHFENLTLVVCIVRRLLKIVLAVLIWLMNDKQKFVTASSKINFLVDDVLALGDGGIRIGLDIGGGSANLAARMAERNATLITSTLNVDAPFNDFIAVRGFSPWFLSLEQRFPFYDNVFDLIHISNGLSNGDRSEKMEFLMFDIDRILQVGGLFWLDNYYCSDNEQKTILTQLIDKFLYKRLKWTVGEKFDVNQAGKPKVKLASSSTRRV
ncbi:hypothetical protein MKX01_016101 [Papaver californicum]|nr:hypothetical protein MKX01_016101 [Papaver californicum]